MSLRIIPIELPELFRSLSDQRVGLSHARYTLDEAEKKLVSAKVAVAQSERSVGELEAQIAQYLKPVVNWYAQADESAGPASSPESAGGVVRIHFSGPSHRTGEPDRIEHIPPVRETVHPGCPESETERPALPDAPR